MMVLYSGTTCPFSQRCRLVLFEKGMDFEVRDVDLFNKPEDISTMNPYGQVPILVERELILYESNIINEYIDERFPHPQLMPADPLMRARARLMLFNFEKELFVHVHVLESERAKGNDKSYDKARAEIRDRLTTLAPLFLKNKYMLGDEFSMLDVAVAPLLWRARTGPGAAVWPADLATPMPDRHLNSPLLGCRRLAAAPWSSRE